MGIHTLSRLDLTHVTIIAPSERATILMPELVSGLITSYVVEPNAITHKVIQSSGEVKTLE
jgi:hypothetical protein